MASFFAPKRPDPTPAPVTPQSDSNAQAARDAAAEEQRRRRLAGGRESTILTSPLGVADATPSAARTLLGA